MSKESPVLVGVVSEIHPERMISEKFSIREFKIVTDDDYPQTLMMSTRGKNMGQLDKVNIGDKVSVKFNINGRDAGPKKLNFLSLDAWSITVLSKGSKPAAKPVAKKDDSEDLPF